MWRVEVVRGLLAAGADPTVEDAHGLNRMDLAKWGDESLRRPKSGVLNQ